MYDTAVPILNQYEMSAAAAAAARQQQQQQQQQQRDGGFCGVERGMKYDIYDTNA